MKTFTASFLLFLTTFCVFAKPEATHAKEERNCAFRKLSEDGRQLTVCRWSAPEKDGSFLLSVEPGCILLKVVLESYDAKVCRFRIIGSPAGQVIIDIAKNTLGIESDRFQIEYTTQSQKLGTTELPAYNRIEAIRDSKSEQVVPHNGP